MCASFPHDSKEKDGVLKGRGFKREWSKRKPKETEEQVARGQLRELRKKQKEKIMIEKQTFEEKKSFTITSPPSNFLGVHLLKTFKYCCISATISIKGKVLHL